MTASYQETLAAGEHFLKLLYQTPHQSPRALMDSDFGFCLEELWDCVHVAPHEHTGVRALGLPSEIRNKITTACHARYPRRPITVFMIVHFPEDYEAALTPEDKRDLKAALRDFGVWNPYREERQRYSGIPEFKRGGKRG